MSLSPEPKPTITTKSNEECSEDFITNVVPAFNTNDETPGFSSDNNDPENNMNKGKWNTGSVSNLVNHSGCEDFTKENELNVDQKFKTEDENDNKSESVKNGILLEEKEMLQVEHDFQQQINIQDDVSRDGSNVSSNSSGIMTDFELHENSDEVMSETGSDDNMFENINIECLSSTNCPSENENSKNFAIQEKEKFNLIKDDNKKEDAVECTRNNELLFDKIKFPYKDPSTAFDIVVPLIGKNVMSVGHIEPFPHRYDLARESNRLKAIEEAPYLPKLSYHEWRKQRDARPQEVKDREERYEKYEDIKTAAYIIKTSVFILQEMEKDDPDEGMIERCFVRFLRAPFSNLSLVLSSQFIHVVMYIRGSSFFSSRLRYVADVCYRKCHVMFPILEGYNFETVYTSECVKNLPDELYGAKDFILDYDDFDCPMSESDDSAISDDNDDFEYSVSENDD